MGVYLVTLINSYSYLSVGPSLMLSKIPLAVHKYKFFTFPQECLVVKQVGFAMFV